MKHSVTRKSMKAAYVQTKLTINRNGCIHIGISMKADHVRYNTEV